jgi:hypothetical protein
MNMNKSFEELMDEIYNLPEGLPRINLLEEAARVADLANDVEDGYIARSMIVEIATFNGYPMKALVAFSWMVGQFDKNEEMYDSFELLWSYKWILDRISCFPDIPLQQIDRLLEDMRDRYKKHGYSERTYYFYRSVNTLLQGNPEEATRCLELFQQMERDGMSDCGACEQNRLVEHAAAVQDDEQALESAQPILKGRMSCGEVPHVTIPKVLMPLYRLNRIDEAKKHQRKGYRLIKDNLEFLQNQGEHIYFLAHTDPFQGLEVLERHYPQVQHHENPMDKMLFLAYSSALLKRLSEETIPVRVRLPENNPHLPAAEGTDSEAGNAAILAERFRQDALAAAERFDRRNGNDFYRTFIEAL